jgi:hypothetical protein
MCFWIKKSFSKKIPGENRGLIFYKKKYSTTETYFLIESIAAFAVLSITFAVVSTVA